MKKGSGINDFFEGTLVVDAAEFDDLVDQILFEIEEAIENCGFEIDYESGDDGTLILFFDNNTEIFIAKQTDRQEIQVTSRSGFYPFTYDMDSGLWQHEGIEIKALLSRECSEQGAIAVNLS